ncbi:hypothetical protein [Streptosporangium canum]|uniref:hypothetical protein n=1 Tax=Streptosporangium canum TaxID=324952 RepID=UPI0033A72861
MAECDALTESGAKGALLRREGLYSTHILDWRLARDHGALQALEPKPPVRKDPLWQAQVRHREEVTF